MKTYGVCHSQSARKHRRAGHIVKLLPSGRYMWSLNRGPLTRAAAERLHADMAQEENRQLLALSGMNPTAIIVDETHDVLKLSGRMVEIPTADMAHALKVTKEDKREVQHVEWLTEGGVARINVGDAYWPKRRNQHSKPYRVRGIYVVDGRATIYFDRGGGSQVDWMSLIQFREVIGKQIL